LSSDGRDDFPEGFGKRREASKKPFFKDIEDMFREIENMMEHEFEDFQGKVPKEYIKERKLPDGSTVKELGPFVHSYSMKIGSDDKTSIQGFGNLKKALDDTEVKEEREPLIDVVNNAEEIRVVVELLGVEKTDIKLYGTDDSLTISVDTPQYKYYKEIGLPSKIRTKEARSTYKNGVLEVIIPKFEPSGSPKDDPININ
jgi:HSP20 family protein